MRAFLRQRLGISVGDFSDEIADALPVELDNLEKWGVGQRLLDAQLEGAEGRTAVLAEIARGSLPPGQLGKPVIDAIWPVVEEIAGQARLLSSEPAGSVDVKLDLGGRPLTGTVAGGPRLAADDGHVLQGQPAPSARGLGAAARAVRAPGARTRRRRSAGRGRARTTTRA